MKELLNERIKHIDNIPYYLPKEIKENFKRALEKVMFGGQDRVYLVTGREGSGKSTDTLQKAYAVDPTFNLKRVAFDSESFAKIIRKANKFEAVVFDEAFNGLSSKGALSKENKRLVKLLIECRQRRLFIFIVLPSMFLLEKYVGIFRSHALFNVMIAKRNYKIRYYKVYDYSQKKELYMRGQKYYSYAFPKIWKMFRFYGKFPPTIEQKEYESKKSRAFQKREKDDLDLKMLMLYHSWWIMKRVHGMKFTEIENNYLEAGFKIQNTIIGQKVREIDKKRIKSKCYIL
jgi:hypothetical protein